MADFSKRININKDTTPFQSVIFGSNVPLLEIELNEIQVLLSNMIRRLSSIVGYYSQSGITFTPNADGLSVDFKMSGIHILNGYVFNIPDGFSINVPHGYRLYLKVEEVDVDRNSQIYNNGIVQSGNEIDNTIMDDRYSMETSMRRSLCITPTITKSSNPGGEYFYVGFSDVDNSTVNTNYFSDTILSQIQDIKETIKSNITQLDLRIDNNVDDLLNHTTNTSNPHSVTKAQVGLGNVENKSSATIREEITKSNITTALGYIPLNQSLKGSADGLAELDLNGKVPSQQLPSFVDDVIEGYLSNGKFYKESAHTTEISGESGKIYIDLSTGKTYRWSGSAFVVISETLALGETSSTAYRGDRGKIAYDHSQSTHARTDATKVEKSSTNGNIKINGTETTVYTHPSGTNPHGTTKSDVGLGNVPNVATNDQTPTYTVASTNTALSSGEKLSVAFGKIAKAVLSLISHLSNTSNPHSVTKSQIGLGNVDNTSDINKPISTAQQNALNGKADLDSTGKVPASQLPSFVDDVLEYSAKGSFPATGETGKIYVDTSTNITYRWSGTTYIEISPSLALGETSSTAYRGDRGKTAYDHSQKTNGNPHGVTKSDVGLGNVDDTSDLDKPVSTAQQEELDKKLSLSGGTMTGSIITPANDSMGIIPASNNYGQIGSSDKKFYRMYATTFYGNLSGKSTSATNDGSGNVITNTYLKKEWKCIFTNTPSSATSISSIVQGDYNEMIVEVECNPGIWSSCLFPIPLNQIKSLNNNEKNFVGGYAIATNEVFRGACFISVTASSIKATQIYIGNKSYLNDSSANMRIYYR